jgi:hypothetical protein
VPTDPEGHRDQTRGSGRSASRRWIPFPVLQASELGLALTFAVLSVHVHNPVLLLGAAALVTLLALSADGPFGALRICGQPLHVHLVAAAAVLIAFAPVVPALRSDIEGILVTTFGAVGLLRLSTLTRVQGPLGVWRRRSRANGPVIDATATVSPPAATAGPDQTATPAAGAAESVLHRTGRAAGAASAAGRRVVERNRPEVEEQVRRGLRKAGRTVGRWTSGTSNGPGDRTP